MSELAKTEDAAASDIRIAPTMPTGLPDAEVERITTDLIGALKTVYDPEIPVDIYELGLIYKVDLDENRNLTIDMTLTAPGCPVAGEMPGLHGVRAREARRRSARQDPGLTPAGVTHRIATLRTTP